MIMDKIDYFIDNFEFFYLARFLGGNKVSTWEVNQQVANGKLKEIDEYWAFPGDFTPFTIIKESEIPAWMVSQEGMRAVLLKIAKLSKHTKA